MSYAWTTMTSAVGPLKLVAGPEGVAAILWENDRPARVPLAPLERDDGHPVLRETQRQLGQYFAGRRTTFDLPLAAEGTGFQKQVWAALSRIPFGETRTYGEIARELGCPTASRAVGAANGRNPISIVVPCHRVIGTSGALTGFAGGLAVKAKLLAIEGRDFGSAVTATSRAVDATRTRRTANRSETPDLFADR